MTWASEAFVSEVLSGEAAPNTPNQALLLVVEVFTEGERVVDRTTEIREWERKGRRRIWTMGRI